MRFFMVAVFAAFFFAPISAAHADASWTCQGNTKTMPAGQLPHCSRSFIVNASCNPTIDNVSLNEYLPWEPFPIVITSIDVAFITVDVLIDAHAGNGYWPDILMLMGYGDRSGHRTFTEGGMPFPSSTAYTTGQWLDLHLICSGNTTEHQVGWYTVGYHPAAPNP